MKTTIKKSAGFTLIEVLVSVSIFAIVMLVATGAVFSIVEANKKTHSLKSVMTNLNFALESMTRDMRVGSQYSCDGGGDCAVTSGDTFTYRANRDINGNGTSNDFVEYTLSDDNRIDRRVFDGVDDGTSPITAEEIYIESMQFYVIGTGVGDGKQPKVVITIKGYAGIGTTRSDFNIQTTVSQRAIDS